MIGPVPGVAVGQMFDSRRELHDADVHRGLMKGIGPQGASIVLSGGYVDDVDEGDLIVYTGEGGRDATTGRQVRDQVLEGGNKALAENYTQGNPVRVNRGHSLDSSFAPPSGYRYDGLYRIDEYWSESGRDGFLIFRYRLVREEGQPPLGRVGATANEPTQAAITTSGAERPGRTTVTTSRVIRNTNVGNEVKKLYDFTCQICGSRLETPSGPYAECCHIRPLGRPHNGPDTPENVLCLCPNHHVLLDAKAIRISDDLTVIETGERLTVADAHPLNPEHLSYHRNLLQRGGAGS